MQCPHRIHRARALMVEKKLTARQVCFVAEFIKDGNATQAAIRAGFSSNGASTQATRMLGNAKIASEIAKMREPVVEAAQITLASHLKALAELRDKAIESEQFAPAVSA